MKCPHCGEELQLVARPILHNVEAYGGSPTSTTACCQKIVQISCRPVFIATTTEWREEDDWGNKVPQYERPPYNHTESQ